MARGTRVLIALDESAESVRAARAAARLFTAGGADFWVINVAAIAVPWIATGFGFGAVSPMAFDQRWFDDEPRRSEDEEADLLRRAQEAGVPHPTALATSGDPVSQICQAAEDHDVDVIVVGSHDKTALRQLFDPSISKGVVRQSWRPVLVVSGPPPLQDGTNGVQ